MEASCSICLSTPPTKPSCITDCGHVFCASCVIKQLSGMNNKCCVCRYTVRRARECVQDNSINPIYVKFSNVTYELYVSKWSIDNSVETLSQMFNLKDAKVIYKGKVMQPDEPLWPGTTVQLTGTRKDTTMEMTIVERTKLLGKKFFQWFYPIFGILYHFFHSFFQKNQGTGPPRIQEEPLNRRPTTPFITPGTASPPTPASSSDS